MKTTITIYNVVSLDGRIEWVKNNFAVMMDYYKLAFRWKVDAVLMGSNSIYELGEHEDISKVMQFSQPEPISVPEEIQSLMYNPKPLLIVPDSIGRISNWTLMQQQPWFRSILVLCSNSTPLLYLDYLRRIGIDYVITGENKVDFNNALSILSETYDIRRIRTDCGGKLTGHLLSCDLVDELKVLVAPFIIGGEATPNLTESYIKEEPIKLKLKDTECINGEYVLLTYDVDKI
jgi:2,5-diamino-6-(ribosylamino)-4(3H)-pyrimidinone 5'-phosphate reductase